jgi:trigger factor
LQPIFKKDKIMNITRKDLSATHAIISVTITKEDYAEKIEKILKDYKKQAVIPGFRKGMVPMSHIQKQYGDAVKFDEINKLVEEKLNNYTATEKLQLLGQPIPIVDNELDIKEEAFTLEFEIAITPKIDLDFSKINVPYYKIIADQEMIDEQLENIQKHFGTKIVKETFEAGNDVKGTITNEEKNINKTVDFNCKIFKNKSIETSLIGKKSGETVTFSSNDLFDNDHKLIDFLHIDHDMVHDLNVELTLTITDIFEIQKADLNQELFDKMFGEGKINSIEELTTKTKEDIEQQYVSHTENVFSNAVEKQLIEKTNVDLPKEFLIKLIQFNRKKQLTQEEAEVEFEKSEQAMKFQIIESKMFTDNNLGITFEELKDFTAAQIKQQMMMYGMLEVDDKMLEDTTMRILSKKEEVQRQSDLLKDKKVLAFYKDILKPTIKEVTVDQFIKEINNE